MIYQTKSDTFELYLVDCGILLPKLLFSSNHLCLFEQDIYTTILRRENFLHLFGPILYIIYLLFLSSFSTFYSSFVVTTFAAH